MKRAYYGPYFRFLMNRLQNKKIIGRAEKSEVQELGEKVADALSKVQSTVSREEILEKISKLNITYTENLPSFAGVAAFQVFNSIFIDKEDCDQIRESDESKLKDNYAFETLVHESIHAIKGKVPLNYERGFIEGSAELLALEATSKNRSSSFNGGKDKINLPATGYNGLVAIMKQFETIFGKEEFEKYALTQSRDLVEKVKQLLGPEDFKKLSSEMYGETRGKNDGIEYVKNWQNVILTKYFDREMESIKDPSEVKAYMEKLDEMQMGRVKSEGDDFYQKYYTTKLKEISQKFPELDLTPYQYKEREFYPEKYYSEKISELDRGTKFEISTRVENYEDFVNLNLEDYKRYRAEKDGKIYEALKYKDKIVSFRAMDESGNYESIFKSDEVSDLSEEGKEESKKSKEIKMEFVRRPKSREESEKGLNIEKLVLSEIPLKVTRREVYSKLQEFEANNIRTESLWEKILRKLKGTKMLPEYTQAAKDSQERHAKEEKKEEEPFWKRLQEEEKARKSEEYKGKEGKKETRVTQNAEFQKDEGQKNGAQKGEVQKDGIQKDEAQNSATHKAEKDDSLDER